MPQVMHDVLAGFRGEVVFGVGADRAGQRHGEQYDDGQREERLLAVPWREVGECVEPGRWLPGPDHVVEDDLDRPWPDEVRRRLDDHRREGDRQQPRMGPENPDDHTCWT